MKAKLLAVVVSGACAMLALPAQAAVGYCVGPPTQTDGLSVSDMTLNMTNADDCYGVVQGNINSAGDLNGLNLTWGTDFELVGDTGGATSGSSLGLDFSLSVVGVGDTSGSWTLTITDPDLVNPLNLPASLDIVGALKGSDRYALYLFDDIQVTAGDNDGTWEITFLNNGGQIPDLSHLAVFVREGDGGIIIEVPEPGALALLGIGLVGLGVMRRRHMSV